MKTIPIETVIMNLDTIYKRIDNNPYINKAYYARVKEQHNKDLKTINEIKTEFINKYTFNILEYHPTEQRR